MSELTRIEQKCDFTFVPLENTYMCDRMHKILIVTMPQNP